MKRYVLMVLAVGVFANVSAADSKQARFDRWGKFGVGSWTSYRTVRPGQDKTETNTFRLVSVTDSEVTVEITTKKGAEVSKRKVTFPFAREDKPDRISKETLDFKERKLKCRVLTYQKQNVKVWQCDEVPGFLVKEEGPKSMTTLVDFRALSR